MRKIEVHGRADHRGAQRGRKGTSAKELCRRLGVGVEMLYRWKRKYGRHGGERGAAPARP